MTYAIRCLMAVLAVGTMTACAGNRLHEFDYADRSLSVVSQIPLRPEILSGPLFLPSTGDPVRDIVRAGARVVREVEAHAARERLEEAADRVDVGYVLEDGVLERAARYLGATPIGEPNGDYVLELVVIEYGIAAEEWDATAYFFIEADAALLHEPTGEEIWRAGIDTSDPVGPEIYTGRSAVRNVVTAAVLADLSVDEIETALEALADFSARVITDRLRDDLRKARRDNR